MDTIASVALTMRDIDKLLVLRYFGVSRFCEFRSQWSCITLLSSFKVCEFRSQWMSANRLG